MAWLKEILEENRRTVASWPEGKREVGMSGFVDKKSYDQLMDDRNERIDENAQLKAELEQARADYEAASHLAAITSQSWKARGAELVQAKAREARLLEALKSIGQIRFLLGNDPRLNPAYEMGAIAQRALEEAAHDG